MAKVNYRSQFSYSFAGQPVVLRAKVSIGASGAATIDSGTGMGIESVTRGVSAGLYAIVLSDKFRDLLDVRAVFASGSSAPAAPMLNIVSESVASGTLSIQMRDAAGVAADPASGEDMYLIIELNRSSTGC